MLATPLQGRQLLGKLLKPAMLRTHPQKVSREKASSTSYGKNKSSKKAATTKASRASVGTSFKC